MLLKRSPGQICQQKQVYDHQPSWSIAFCALWLIWGVLFCFGNSGCRLMTGTERPRLFQGRLGNQGQVKVTSSIPNPMVVPMMDRWYLMDEISDELDNYFKIYREDRIRIIDGVMTEGFIETHPQIGGTLLEPWKSDSSPGFELAQATLQTVRRFAKVRVIPMGNSYQIDLQVYKELEDLERPVGSPFGGAIFRQYHSLGDNRGQSPVNLPSTGWIPQGRDFQLEQKILANISKRLSKSLE